MPGLYAAGDMASIPHNYMLGAFTYGNICARTALEYLPKVSYGKVDDGFVERERQRVLAPLHRPKRLLCLC